MELASSLSEIGNQISLPSAEGTSKKRALPPASKLSAEALPSLKLRRTPTSQASLSSNDLTGSHTDLSSLSALQGNFPTETKVHESLRAYVYPSTASNSSPFLLPPSAAFRSSTAETEKTLDNDYSDTDTTITELAQTSPVISSPTSEESVTEDLPDWAFQEPEDVTHLENSNDILASKGIQRSPQFFGKGNFGRVYAATIRDSPKPYLYKHYLKPVSFDHAEGKFWRQSDFAASRLHDIPHLVKPLFFIVVVKGSDGSQKKVFLPASKVQQFGQSLPPGSKVFLQGQLMEKALGRPLDAWRESGLMTLSPDRDHFRNIAIGLQRFLTASRPHNLMHRDLSLSNIIYDKESRRVSIIDLGQGLRLRSRGKAEETMKNKISPNPATSKVFTGTPDFMAPAVIHQQDYGAEVDTASVALLLLNLVDEEDFENFSSSRFAQVGPDPSQLQDLHFGGKDPATFLQTYLEKIAPNSKTERMLERYPAVREIIDLAFRASAPGADGEAAFSAFQSHPYFAS
ncbi:MAG: hypothetical protein FJ390_03625 [Verrucomicrobia bacterium]|nr:hypothetical protein [Verrucomicrobiota bacterium]